MRASRLVDCARWLLIALVFTPVAAWAQGGGPAALDGKRVTYTVSYSMDGIKQNYGPFHGAKYRVQGDLHISGNSVSGSGSATTTYRDQLVGSSSYDLSGEIGQWHKTGARGGNYMWAFDGHSLTLLRTYAVGGSKLTITFGRGGCSVRGATMRETGAGAMVSGHSTITSLRQVSSTCTVGG